MLSYDVSFPLDRAKYINVERNKHCGEKIQETQLCIWTGLFRGFPLIRRYYSITHILQGPFHKEQCLLINNISSCSIVLLSIQKQ